VPGFAEDDVLLQMVMLVGTVCSDPVAGTVMGNARLVRMLFDILQDKSDDVDLVLQCIYTLYKMAMLREPRQQICKHDQLTLSVLDLVVDPNPSIRDFSNMVLDIIMEEDEDWRAKIREKRFEACNREWLDFIHGGGVPPGGQFDQSAGEDSGAYDNFYDTGRGGGGGGYSQYDRDAGLQSPSNNDSRGYGMGEDSGNYI
jgi:hypothetical protein